MIVTVTSLGCGSSEGEPDATVQGAVTIEGVLAERGTVSFHPVEGGPVAIGTINPDGTFALRVGRGNLADADASKIYSGGYVATVIVHAPSTVQEEHPELPPRPGPRLTAERFSKKSTSGLEFNVKPGLNVFPIEVESSASDPVDETDAEDADAETIESDDEQGDAEAVDVQEGDTEESGAEDGGVDKESVTKAEVSQ